MSEPHNSSSINDNGFVTHAKVVDNSAPIQVTSNADTSQSHMLSLAYKIRSVFSRGLSLLKQAARLFFEVFVRIFGDKRFIRTMLLIIFLALVVLGIEGGVTHGVEYRNISIEPMHLYFVDLKDTRFIDYEFADELIDDYNLEQKMEPSERKYAEVLWLDLRGSITDYCEGAVPSQFVTSAGICAPLLEQFFDWLYAQDYLDIKGLLITIDSPGGEQTASDRLFRAIKKVSKKLKVYVFVPDFIASGGVYVSAAANKIFVSPWAFVGNIGVKAEFVDYTELLRKLGIKRVTYVSSNAKYKTLRGLLDDDREDPEDKYFQAALDAAELQFHKRLLEGRGTLDLKKVANGLIFPAKEAVGLNLVDDIAEDEYEVLRRLLKDVNLKGKEYVLITKVTVSPQVSLLTPILSAVNKVFALLQGQLPGVDGLRVRILLQ